MTCIGFFTRIPLPSSAAARQGGDFAQAFRAAPVAGALAGLGGGIALAGAHGLGLDAFVAAVIALAVLTVLTGAMHEDGLADMADGLGGRDREARLTIMRDSRLGVFGGAALVLGYLLRAGLMAAVLAAGSWAAVAALVAAHGVARAAVLMPLNLLPPARTDGLGARAAVDSGTVLRAALIAAALAAVTVTPGFGLIAAPLACAAAAAAAWGVCAVARRAFGGQTGDVCGAAAIAAETGFLMMLAVLM